MQDRLPPARQNPLATHGRTIHWVKGAFGESGILVLSAVVGLTDIDPFVLNIAQGGIGGMTVASLCAAVLIAASSKNLAKAAYAVGLAARPRAARPSRCSRCRCLESSPP
jgi:uncharacterized membrane protein (DUF4010 family)